MSVNDTHEERETLAVDVFLPGHDARTTTALFTRTKRALLDKTPRCFICDKTADELGEPLESHHVIVERCLANAIDFDRVRADVVAGVPFAIFAAAFDWSKFDAADPLAFVDDQTANGLILCKEHHTGKGKGIHYLPFPLWLAQRYLRDGYQFAPDEIIHHEAHK